MKCYICGEFSIKKYKWRCLCEKHFRFIQMMKAAKTDKKYVPSIYEIERHVPADMKCQDCGDTMHWIDNNKRNKGAVLQHYRDGTIGIVCMACNTKHGLLPGDLYREIPSGHKLCRACKTIKPLSMFYLRKDSGKPYPKTHCKSCDLEAHKRWRKNNPDKYKETNKKHNDLRKLRMANKNDEHSI